MKSLAIREDQGDDPAFIGLVSAAIRGMASMEALEHFAVVTIDNWFDDRWVGFPGVFTEYRDFCGARLPHKHSKGCVLPPFARSRVIDCLVYGQPSQNLAAVFYVSSRSEINRRASLLASLPSDEECWNWYVGFKYQNEWKPIRHKNIGHEEFARYVAAGT